MGSNDGGDDEDPVHTVYLDGYYISKYEITNKQYKQFCDATGRDYPDDPGFNGMSNYFTNYPDYPVVEVSWHDAKAYCDWAGLKLPTEAQWEKGARGTDARKYTWGNSDSGTNKANKLGSSDGYKYTSPVGSYTNGQSPYGLMNMAGNVMEWCNDRYDSDYYSSSQSSNPKGPSSGKYPVIRGGSWGNPDFILRCAYRYWFYPSFYCSSIGFRPALY